MKPDFNKLIKHMNEISPGEEGDYCELDETGKVVLFKRKDGRTWLMMSIHDYEDFKNWAEKNEDRR